MEPLRIDQTINTPKVIFDPDELFLRISGPSRPESADKFFAPLIKWLNDFKIQRPSTSVPLNVEIKIAYLNSASRIYLTSLFKIINEIHIDGMRVLIDWFVDEDDDVMRETGQELSENTGLPFNIVEE
ncbi:MAG: DUF1987 domain-containing protein [Bacteroidales bacterium]|nr:DUF1987 domain-containing protein [Bacteroidales bacterium]MBN2818340.1 DUF1987 domain-containing protein [Bacteroidales bacterium]